MDKTSLELRVPSELGNEKYAMRLAQDVAAEMGFPQDKIENLKIAIAEACLNAIEHGNKEKANMKVIIDFTLHESELEINIQNLGESFVPESIEKPSLKDKIEGKDKKKRGWGMFIIKSMVDEMEYLNIKGKTQLRMIIKLPQEEEEVDNG